MFLCINNSEQSYFYDIMMKPSIMELLVDIDLTSQLLWLNSWMTAKVFRILCKIFYNNLKFKKKSLEND